MIIFPVDKGSMQFIQHQSPTGKQVNFEVRKLDTGCRQLINWLFEVNIGNTVGLLFF